MTIGEVNFLALAILIAILVPPIRNTVRAFFQEVDYPETLAIFRIAVFGLISGSLVGLFEYGRSIPLAMKFAALPPELQVPARGWGLIYSTLPVEFGIDPDPPILVGAVGAMILVSSLLAMIGYRTRITGFIAGSLLIYYLVVFHSYNKVNHDHHLVWFALLLAASPSADRFAVDARRGRHIRDPDVASQAYAFPLRVTWLLMGMIYFFPGISKLRTSGLDWVFSDNLMNQMYAKWFTHNPMVPRVDLAQFSEVLHVAALGTVIFEIGFLFAVLVPRIRPVAAGLGISFHIATWITMGIPFVSIWPAYLTFLPWRKITNRLSRVVDRGEWRPRGEEPHRDDLRGRRDYPILQLAMATALITGFFVANVQQVTNGWPFGHYPRFDRLAGPNTRTIVVQVEEQRYRLSELIPWMPNERSAGLIRGVVRHPEERLPALREALDLPPVEITFWVETYPLHPDVSVHDEPVRRRQLR